MTAVRNWIKKTLLAKFPRPGTIWSDTQEDEFKFLTGLSQNELLKKWFQFKDGKPDYDTKGPDPGFTTCTSFLPRFASTVCGAGRVAAKPLAPFRMPTTKGWSPSWLTDSVAGGPQEGDFYLIGDGGQFKHVGIIVQIEGQMWSVVGGGAGGRSSRHDGVKRSPLQPRPNGVLGVLNADVYFEDWSGPNL